MKLAVLSDIHANGDALAAVEREIAARRPDRVYHLGDLVGYNAEPERCVRWAMDRTAGGVSGNHDAVACGRSSGRHFHPSALTAALWAGERLTAASRSYLAGLPVQLAVEGGVLLVHGSPTDSDRYILSAEHAAAELSTLFASVAEGPILFGHTHLAGGFVRRKDGNVERVSPGEFRLLPGERALLNPGSIGQPRDRNRDASFLVYDTESGSARWTRVPYDVEAARRKVLAAGLPAAFADRLQDGT